MLAVVLVQAREKPRLNFMLPLTVAGSASLAYECARLGYGYRRSAIVGFRSQAVPAKDRSPAPNIDADGALISLKEMPITPVEANHHGGDVARWEIGGLAVERAALIKDS